MLEENETKTEEKQNSESAWKSSMNTALSQLKNATKIGVEKSEQYTALVKQQVKKKLLLRNRNKLMTELGEIAFKLLDKEKVAHQDLDRPFERIVKLDKEIEAVEQALNKMRE